jgi:hypothetical protein
MTAITTQHSNCVGTSPFGRNHTSHVMATSILGLDQFSVYAGEVEDITSAFWPQLNTVLTVLDQVTVCCTFTSGI